jgi:CheY-like chemotaxis protein
MAYQFPAAVTHGVLVVEEEESLRRLLEAALPAYGLSVWLAGGVQEAVQLYRRHRGDIGVVLLDAGLHGTDGPHTLAALRQADPGVRAVFMASDPARCVAQGLPGLGAAAVEKPPPSLAGLAVLLHEVAAGRCSPHGTSPATPAGAGSGR